MQRLEVSGAVRQIYGSLGAKGLILSLVSGIKRPSSGVTTLAVWCVLHAVVDVGRLQVMERVIYWAWGCGCRSSCLVG
jgi:hypothetical protein